MSDNEVSTTATHPTAAEWWAAHPEEHEPRASRALGYALLALAAAALAVLAWVLL